MMKTAIAPIYLVYQGTGGKGIEPMPFGLLYVGKALSKAGFRVRVFHLRGAGDDRLERAVAEERPLFVGFSNFLTPVLWMDVERSRRLHERGIKVVWGGIFSIILPEVVLGSGLVDYVVTGEGERAAPALAEAIAQGRTPSGIPGVGYMNDGQMVLEPAEPAESDLDRFDFGLELVDLSLYVDTTSHPGHRYIQIPFSRGCPYQCTFCYNSMNMDRRRWKSHGAEYMKEMVGRLRKEAGIDMVAFTCDNAFGRPTRAMEVIEGLEVAWKSPIHLGSIKEDFLDWAGQTGCQTLGFGAESGSDRMLKYLGKSITADTIRDKVHLCESRGISSVSSWMGLMPTETTLDLSMTFSLMNELSLSCPNHRVKFFIFWAYPMTRLWEPCLELGIKEPTSLEQWGRFEGPIGQLMGYSPRQMYWMWALTNIVFNPQRATTDRISPALTNYFRKKIIEAEFPPRFTAALEIARSSRAVYRKIRSAL